MTTRSMPSRMRAAWRAGLVWLVLLVMGAVVGWAGAAVGGQQVLERTTAALDAHIPRLMEAYDVPGVAVALVVDGSVVWSKAYGHADLESDRPMSVESVVRAESISKSVTAWGVMTLVERGLIDLDAPVVGYLGDGSLPDSDLAEEEITIRQLLSHTAGMPLGTIGVHYSPYGEIPSLEEELASEARLVREPGRGFSYSNVGFDLLELVVEEVTGEDFADYMQRAVLRPLGMTESSFAWRNEVAPRVPTGYDLRGDPVPPYVYPASASGGLFTTVGDLARFVSAEVGAVPSAGRTVIEPESIRQLQTPEAEITGLFRFVSDSYGLGHFVETLSSGERVVWHGGQGNGWMTDFHAVPEMGDGIVIVTNSQRSWPLIAEVLQHWTESRGLGSVGFSGIIAATTGVWVLIGIAMSGSAWQLWRIGRGLRTGWRRLVPSAQRTRVLRLAQALLGATLVVVLIWSTTQDYLFVFSVFPTATRWLGIAIAGLSVACVASAVTPVAQGSRDGRIPSHERKETG